MISPRVAKIIESLPHGFVAFLARKILHGYLDKNANIKIDGEDNLRNLKGPVIFICNHLSNADGLILNRLLVNNNVTFVAGVKLSDDYVTKLGTYIAKTTPIKPDTADKEGLAKIIKLLREGNNICIFPEGTRSRDGVMIKAKKGLFLISKMGKANIVPIGMWGTEKLMPVNKAGDMSSESFHKADVYINIGKSLSIPAKLKDEDRKDYEERAIDEVMVSIAKLLPKEYRGYYSFDEK